MLSGGISTADNARATLLLEACIQQHGCPERAQALEQLRGEAAHTIKIFPALREALCSWPSRRLATLVLEVLPAVLDVCTVPTPHGCVRGSCLDCSASPLVTYYLRSPVLKSLHCLFCCGIACAKTAPLEASAVLRSATGIARRASAIEKPKQLYELFGAFLQAMLDAAPGLLRSLQLSQLFGGSDAQPSAALVSACLQLRSLRLALVEAEGEAGVSGCTSAAKLQELEALAC
eukprot:gnl/TRDRNA2_/TRDRNA2_118689_c1_seq1.p1 gnl/TRDRNA2_/TRDRNA2_118689_c1~~gnl/TRDRNA2_/TRDRNA2_118689_c1_seq1.p1  ORF type:complete len:233 (-),score=37.03 gnl/TRDRNA2_/TRDRNA2_118689_c1_seq1:76-774(-)